MSESHSSPVTIGLVEEDISSILMAPFGEFSELLLFIYLKYREKRLPFIDRHLVMVLTTYKPPISRQLRQQTFFLVLKVSDDRMFTCAHIRVSYLINKYCLPHSWIVLVSSCVQCVSCTVTMRACNSQNLLKNCLLFGCNLSRNGSG